MNISPIEFIEKTLSGESEIALNKNESDFVDYDRLNELVKKYGHTKEEATEYLLTDYSNGYTVCKCCGSFYQLGKGFKKHLSNGCLNCEGEAKHRVYHVEASAQKYGGFPARYMSVMFDDGMSYCVDELQKELYKNLFNNWHHENN